MRELPEGMGSASAKNEHSFIFEYSQRGQYILCKLFFAAFRDKKKLLCKFYMGKKVQSGQKSFQIPDFFHKDFWDNFDGQF